MKTLIIALLAIVSGFAAWAFEPQDYAAEEPSGEENLEGEWVRFSSMGPISLVFRPDGTVEADLGRDNSVDIVSEYSIENGTIIFRDREGVTCPGTGIYKLYLTDHFLSFDLVEDNCAGRLKSTMGFWVRPDFGDRIKSLSEQISASAEPEKYLSRARMYMAIGKSYEAMQDFNEYIRYDSTDARVYVNRAGTRFPTDLEGVVADCNRAIVLEPASKNAYFLRGLALYETGSKESACEDFQKAIELGFTILREAEYQRCSEFWESHESE